MPQTPPFDAVLFDMDGLLLDSERAYMAAFLAALERFGLPRDPELFLSCVGVRSAETDAILRPRLEPAVSVSDFRTAWFDGVGELLGGDIPRRPGVDDLLGRLAAAGVRMGVATSTRTEVARGRLERSGLADRFELVVGGDEVTHAKPDPEIYLELARRMGVDVARCAAFEDSNPGTRAAVASGAVTVQVPDLTAPTPEIEALGHVIAGDILTGARRIGLIAG